MLNIQKKINLYLQLMRIDKPIGFYLLLWPVIWAFLVSANGVPNLYYLSIFVLGVIATRSAGCVINDYFDQKIDKKVERTKNRVLANQNISNEEALVIFFLLILTNVLRAPLKKSPVVVLCILLILLSLAGCCFVCEIVNLKKKRFF